MLPTSNTPESHSGIRPIVFYSTVILLFLTLIPLSLFPEKSSQILNIIFNYMTVELTWVFMLSSVIILIFLLWLAFGPISKKKLGDKIEYSTFTWIGMVLCAGVGAGCIFGGSIEWAMYAKYSIQGTQPLTQEAYEWAIAYGMFHWGPTIWAFYVCLSIPIGYIYFVKKKPVLNVSQSCEGILGRHTTGFIGKIIDIIFMVGLIIGGTTSLGFGIYIVAASISSIFNIEYGFPLEAACMIGVAIIYMISSSLGLKKGMAKLSDINVYTALALFAFVAAVGPTLFIGEMAAKSLWLMYSNLIDMMTWVDPVGKGGFTQDWTVFYMAWFISISPFISLFFAKISRGRSVRAVVLGGITIAALGSGISYMILGSYGIHLQITGQLDAVKMLETAKGGAVIMAIYDTLPFANFYKFLLGTVVAICIATTFDAISFALAATSSKRLTPDTEPATWCRLFWGFAVCILPLGIMAMNGPLMLLQILNIIVGIPLLIVMFLSIGSFIINYKREGWVENNEE